MFSKMIAYHDRSGKRLEPEDALKFALTATAVKASSFQLETGSGTRCGLPVLMIVRNYRNPRTDPYCDDGRPATLMVRLASPHLLFLGNVVEITGFELPNLYWAGKVRPAYDGQPPLKLPRERQFTEEEAGLVHRVRPDDAVRQKIALVV